MEPTLNNLHNSSIKSIQVYFFNYMLEFFSIHETDNIGAAQVNCDANIHIFFVWVIFKSTMK